MPRTEHILVESSVLTWTPTRVYCMDGAGELRIRPASAIGLDPDEIIYGAPEDAMRPLHVRGLHPRDLFVFADVGREEEPTANIGYIVGSHINPDSTGVIVPGDSVEEHPGTYLSQPMRERLLFAIDALAEVGLEALAQRLRLFRA